jgi:hypothetical protein
MITGKDKSKFLLMVSDLEKDEQQIEMLNETIRRMKEKEGGIEKCGVSIEFGTINAFSIERNIVDDTEKTIIGYISEGRVHEWSLMCSRESHERLVKEFNEYKARKR